MLVAKTLGAAREVRKLVIASLTQE